MVKVRQPTLYFGLLTRRRQTRRRLCDEWCSCLLCLEKLEGSWQRKAEVRKAPDELEFCLLTHYIPQCSNCSNHQAWSVLCQIDKDVAWNFMRGSACWSSSQFCLNPELNKHISNHSRCHFHSTQVSRTSLLSSLITKIVVCMEALLEPCLVDAFGVEMALKEQHRVLSEVRRTHK